MGSMDDERPELATMPDPLDLLARMTIEQVRDRLDEIEAERRGLKVLLRAVEARERARAQSSRG